MKIDFTFTEGATHIDNSNNIRHTAFTLAEVLITLGIIGVVAAMTMPVLLANHRKTVAETRLAKFYSTMNQAVQRAEVDYGDKTLWGNYEVFYETTDEGKTDWNKKITNTEFFNKYFKPYIIAIKIKDNKKLGKTMVYFPDGSLAAFGGDSILFWPNAKDYREFLTDETTGNVINDVEASGIKYFTFMFSPTINDDKHNYHYGKGIEPYLYNWDGDINTLRNSSSIGCNKNATNERAYCTALIQMNGWKIPKDYPLRF